MLKPEIQEYLEECDASLGKFDSYHGEHSIGEQINQILRDDKDFQASQEDLNELFAFQVMADNPNRDYGWGTYYGPYAVFPDDQGVAHEYPSLQRLDESTIDYWTQRMGACNNKLLKARYADVILDFFSKLNGSKPPVAVYYTVIDSNIEIANELLAYPLDCLDKLKRALNLSIRLNDSKRMQEVKNAIISLEKKIAIDTSPGLWGFSFELLVLNKHKKLAITEDEISQLLQELETRLGRVKNNSSLVESSVNLLAEYYAQQEDEDNLMRVLTILEESLKADERGNSEALLIHSTYQRLLEHFTRYASRSEKSEIARKRIIQEITQLDLNWQESMKKISSETTIDREHINVVLNEIFGPEDESSLSMVIAQAAIGFVPSKTNMEKLLNENFRKHPLQYLITTQLFGEDNILKASLFSFEDQYKDYLAHFGNNYLQFGSVILHFTTEKLTQRFAKEEIIKHFSEAFLFQNEDHKFIDKAFSAYWDGEYLVASHLFCPLIESVIRQLIKICGGAVLKHNDYGGFDQILLNGLLNNEEIFKGVYGSIGEDILFYFRLVLVEKLGMNLRNNFAHGFSKSQFHRKDVSDRLLHILFWLAIVRENKKE